MRNSKPEKVIVIFGSKWVLTDTLPADMIYHSDKGAIYVPEKKPETDSDIRERLELVNLRSVVSCSENQMDKLMATQFALAVAEELNGDWEADWDDHSTPKFSFGIDGNGKIYISKFKERRGSPVYFKSWKIAARAVKIIGAIDITLIVN